MIGEALGMTLAQGAGNMLFGQFNQDMALKGQQKALKQQNDAAMDIWNKTNYWAQRQQIEKAGLNPALLYGMGSGGGGQIGQSGSNMQGDVNAPNMGMGIQAAAQLELLQAQKENIQADTKNKLADATRTAGSQTDLDKAMTTSYQSLAKNNDARTTLVKVETDMAKIEKDILDVTQWYEMGIKLEEWRRLQGEARSALAKGDVDESTINNAIAQKDQDLVIKYAIEKQIKAGTALDYAKATEAYAMAQAALKNADTNKLNYLVNELNAGTNALNAKTAIDRLELDKEINNISKQTGMAVEVVKDIILLLAFRGVFTKGRTVIEGFKQIGRKLY